MTPGAAGPVPSMPMTDRTFPEAAYCPRFQRIVELLGRRWTASIVRVLFCGERRFSDIADAVPGLSHRLLAARLRELRDAGLVEIAESDGHRVYRLTEAGGDLRGTFAELEAWNRRWHATGDASSEASPVGGGSSPDGS